MQIWLFLYNLKRNNGDNIETGGQIGHGFRARIGAGIGSL